MKVSLVCEELLLDVPSGMHDYIRGMLGALPRFGVRVEPVVARHRSGELFQAGLSHARELGKSSSSLQKRWAKGGKPTVAGDADLVHAPSLLAPPKDDRPLVITVHDLLYREYPEGLPKRAAEIYDETLKRVAEADLVICPSEAAKKELHAHAVEPTRVEIVPMGTDLQAPTPDDREKVLEKLEVQRPYVLWIGTVEPRRNPEGVIRGFIHAIEAKVPRHADLNLYLVGPPGWWPTEVGEFVESRGMTDRVRRLDAQPAPHRAALYAAAEAFVFPSHGEGFPHHVLEAMACGAPVVTSGRSSMPEVAGAAAEFCDPSDATSIGNALAKVLKDAELASDMGRLGKKRAAELSWERAAHRTFECYKQLLEGRGRS